MMLKNPAVLHALLEHLTDGIADYACHQAACGAQVPIAMLSLVFLPCYQIPALRSASAAATALQQASSGLGQLATSAAHVRAKNLLHCRSFCSLCCCSANPLPGWKIAWPSAALVASDSGLLAGGTIAQKHDGGCALCNSQVPDFILKSRWQIDDCVGVSSTSPVQSSCSCPALAAQGKSAAGSQKADLNHASSEDLPMCLHGAYFRCGTLSTCCASGLSRLSKTV